MLVAAQSMGYASGLASGAAMNVDAMRTLLRLTYFEQAVCFIGLGTPSQPKPPRARPDAAQFLTSL